MRGTKLYGIIAAAFMAGAFLASPELRAYASTIANDVICSGCVGTSDLAGNAVTAAKIKDSEVKAAEIAASAVGASEIAANSVGASELIGVTKLIFAECTTTSIPLTNPGGVAILSCPVMGAESGDQAIASKFGGTCFAISVVLPTGNLVDIHVRNVCGVAASEGGLQFSIMVYDK
ncbi:MAG: hypothetical protein ACREA4_12525 [Nitrososphaera sp.]